MATVEATFSVNVNKIVEEKNPQSVVKNIIRRISKTNTWFDLFDYATDTLSEDTLPRYAWDQFGKMASVSVSYSPSGEQFNVDPYEKIHVLSDFDSSLKYVTINLKLEATDINNNSEKSGQQNALSLLIAARTATKKAKPLDASGPKFTAKSTAVKKVNPALYAGTIVRISGLQKRPTLNEKLGLLITLHAEKERWQVTVIHSGENVLLKPDNLAIDDKLFFLIVNDRSLMDRDECHILTQGIEKKVKRVSRSTTELSYDIYRLITDVKPPGNDGDNSPQRKVLLLGLNAFGHNLLLDVIKVGQDKFMGRIIQCYVKHDGELINGIAVPDSGFTTREWLGLDPCKRFNNMKWMSHDELKLFTLYLQKLRTAITNLVESELLVCAEQFVPHGSLAKKRQWASRMKTTGANPNTGLTMQPGSLELVEGYAASLQGSGLPKHATIYHGIYTGRPKQLLDFPITTLKEIMILSKKAFSIPNPVMAFTFLAAIEWHKNKDAWHYVEIHEI